MKYLARMGAMALGLLLALSAGCGGGSSGGGSVVPRDQAFGGLWSGSLAIDGMTGMQDLVGMSTDDGRFQFLSVDTAGQFAGTATLSGSSVSGTGQGFAPPGTTWRDGTTVTNITFTATLSERRSLAGSWRSAAGESGRFELDYDRDYEKDSSLALVAGTWTVYDDNLNPFATFTVEADGRFFGQNVLGCTSLGQISLIDQQFNVYDVESTISGCPIAGDYAGLATLGELVNPNDVLLASLSNDQRALLLAMER